MRKTLVCYLATVILMLCGCGSAPAQFDAKNLTQEDFIKSYNSALNFYENEHLKLSDSTSGKTGFSNTFYSKFSMLCKTDDEGRVEKISTLSKPEVTYYDENEKMTADFILLSKIILKALNPDLKKTEIDAALSQLNIINRGSSAGLNGKYELAGIAYTSMISGDLGFMFNANISEQ